MIINISNASTQCLTTYNNQHSINDLFWSKITYYISRVSSVTSVHQKYIKCMKKNPVQQRVSKSFLYININYIKEY